MKYSPPDSESPLCVVDNKSATINLCGILFCSERDIQDYYYDDFLDDNFSCYEPVEVSYFIKDVIDRAFDFLCA